MSVKSIGNAIPCSVKWSLQEINVPHGLKQNDDFKENDISTKCLPKRASSPLEKE